MASTADLLVQNLINWVAIITVAAIFQRMLPYRVVGLALTYMLGLSIIHLAGAAVHALPWFIFRDIQWTPRGFQQSLIGLGMFAVGAVVVAPLLYHLFPQPLYTQTASATPRSVEERLALIYTAVGLFSQQVLSILLRELPTVTALVTVTNQLLIVGIALGALLTWQQKRWKQLALWACAALYLPLQSIIFQGFLGFGVIALLTIAIFVISSGRIGWQTAVILLIAAFAGISLYVTYARDRSDIRNTVWGNQALGARVAQLYVTLSNFEWFDPQNQEHLRYIDLRLNQNSLVGLAVYNLSLGYHTYAEGETLWEAMLALAPRALWPDKPVQAGSPEIVSAFTGLEFAEGTSVGIGQVLEFYINFGTSGVIVGFLLLGIVVGLFDLIAGWALSQGRQRSFLFWYLAGLGLLQPGGSLVEVTASMLAGFVTAVIVSRALVPIIQTLFGNASPHMAGLPKGADRSPSSEPWTPGH
jgi:hypothetical protein